MEKTNKIISQIKELLKDQERKTKIDDPIKVNKMKEIFNNADYLDIKDKYFKYNSRKLQH